MAVYVDDAFLARKRIIIPSGERWVMQCHMIADTTEELFEMAKSLGVSRQYVKNAGKCSEHFEITALERRAALKAGALATSKADIDTRIRAKWEARRQLEAAATE